MRTAIRLMYVGAAVSLFDVIVGVPAESRDARYAARHAGSIVGARAHAMAGDIGLTAVLGGSVGVLCWILVAMACRRGHGWTRTVASTLLGLHMIGLLVVLLTIHGDPVVKITSLVIWAIGLTTVILLWSQQAREFFFAWRGR